MWEVLFLVLLAVFVSIPVRANFLHTSSESDVPEDATFAEACRSDWQRTRRNRMNL